jgi:putative DNA primase/helicase
MNQVVTVERLAAAKRLPPDVLRSFGLSDVPEGVRFDYRTAENLPARPRLRIAMRGADGSQWVSPSTLPIAVYTPPASVRTTVDPESLIIVEGESDCWSAWYHGVPAIGIPGADHADKLELEHVQSFSSVYLLREPAPAGGPTYKEGVETYLQNIQHRLKKIGYKGNVFEFTMPDGLYDLSELHQDDPEQFVARLARAKEAAQRQ